MKTAVAYMRYSSDNQTENSITYQRNAILAYAVAKKIDVVDEYIDEAYSGTTDQRPAFQQLLTDAESKPAWDTVLIFDRSRFARNHKEAAMNEDRLADAGIQLVSVTQKFKDDPEGCLMKGIFDLFNEYYSRVNAKHTHAGMMAKARAGKHCGGTPPLGYRVNDEGELEIDPVKAEAVRMIFDMFEMGYSYSRMAKTLNESGYTNSLGDPFSEGSFYELLHQEKYTGTYVWNRTRQKNSKHRRNTHAQKPQEQQVVIPNGIPAIITREQFDRVQADMRALAEGSAASKSRYHYMLGGLKVLRCAKCGSLMVGLTNVSHGKRRFYYACPGHRSNGCPTKNIRADRVEQFVAAALADNAFTGIDLATLSDEINTLDSSVKTLKRQQRQVEDKIKNIVKSLAKCRSDDLFEYLQVLNTERNALAAKIKTVQQEEGQLVQADLPRAKRDLKRYLRKSTDLEAKQYIKENVEEITVDNTGLNLKLRVV